MLAPLLGLDLDDLLGLRPPHVEGVGDDPRAGLELLQLGHELDVQARQQVERDDVRLAQVLLEDVLLLDRHQLAHPVLLDVLVRLLDALRVDVEADGLDAVLLRRGDQDAAVAAAEVVDDVPLLHLGQLEHLVDDLLGRRDEDDVGGLGLARLACASPGPRPSDGPNGAITSQMDGDRENQEADSYRIPHDILLEVAVAVSFPRPEEIRDRRSWKGARMPPLGRGARPATDTLPTPSAPVQGPLLPPVAASGPTGRRPTCRVIRMSRADALAPRRGPVEAAGILEIGPGRRAGVESAR